MVRKVIKTPFKQLVLENKKELMNDEKEMKRIEKRIDDKYMKISK
ncbi:FbpB family small basic protein [Bacillus songklensis]|uniref:FbpB family small basic protein n=1 Tax=Bacillus songklensis TaxID=1069116 RepID=A0ABV8B8M2_9BACI